MDFEIKNGTLVRYNGTASNVVIPEGVVRVKEDAFPFDCSDFESISFPASLNRIDYNAFHGITRTVSVHIVSLEAWLNLKLGGKSYPDCPVFHISYDLYINGQKLENLVVPPNVMKISKSLFQNCRSLKRVEIQGAEEIEAFSFASCHELQEVIIADSVKKIGDNAFDGCCNLGKCHLPASITKINPDTFLYCTKLEEITIPEGVNTICSSAFENCRRLIRLHIPQSLRSIDDSAFCSCAALEHIDLPDGIKMIGASAFCNCESLKELIVPHGIKQIAADALPKNLETIMIKCKMSAFAPEAFKDLKALKIVCISEDEYEKAKRIVKRVKFNNLKGQPMGGKESSASGESVAAAFSCTAESIQVIYPEGKQNESANQDPFIRLNGKPKAFAVPARQKLTVLANGQQFFVWVDIGQSGNLFCAHYETKDKGEDYDLQRALGNVSNWYGFIDDETGKWYNSPLEKSIAHGLEPLAAQEVEKRLFAFAAILNQCVSEDSIKRIFLNAEKKKDGFLSKNRIQHLALLRLVKKEGMVFKLVAKNEDETAIRIEMRSEVPATSKLLNNIYLLES